MTIINYIYMLLTHWLADFCLQTDEQAKGKSLSIKLLTYHVGTYTLVMGLSSFYYFDDWRKCVIFTAITSVSHWITDFFTSRIGKPFWAKGDYHNGFVVVGFDQILHYVQLFVTIDWLKNLVL